MMGPSPRRKIALNTCTRHWRSKCLAANRPGKIKEEEIDTWRSRIVEVMDDDINSAAALGILATAARALNDALAIKGKALKSPTRSPLWPL